MSVAGARVERNLPYPWFQYFTDEDYEYFYNEETGELTWDDPFEPQLLEEGSEVPSEQTEEVNRSNAVQERSSEEVQRNLSNSDSNRAELANSNNDIAIVQAKEGQSETVHPPSVSSASFMFENVKEQEDTGNSSDLTRKDMLVTERSPEALRETAQEETEAKGTSMIHINHNSVTIACSIGSIVSTNNNDDNSGNMRSETNIKVPEIADNDVRTSQVDESSVMQIQNDSANIEVQQDNDISTSLINEDGLIHDEIRNDSNTEVQQEIVGREGRMNEGSLLQPEHTLALANGDSAAENKQISSSMEISIPTIVIEVPVTSTEEKGGESEEVATPLSSCLTALSLSASASSLPALGTAQAPTPPSSSPISPPPSSPLSPSSVEGTGEKRSVERRESSILRALKEKKNLRPSNPSPVANPPLPPSFSSPVPPRKKSSELEEWQAGRRPPQPPPPPHSPARLTQPRKGVIEDLQRVAEGERIETWDLVHPIVKRLLQMGVKKALVKRQLENAMAAAQAQAQAEAEVEAANGRGKARKKGKGETGSGGEDEAMLQRALDGVHGEVIRHLLGQWGGRGGGVAMDLGGRVKELWAPRLSLQVASWMETEVRQDKTNYYTGYIVQVSYTPLLPPTHLPAASTPVNWQVVLGYEQLFSLHSLLGKLPPRPAALPPLPPFPIKSLSSRWLGLQEKKFEEMRRALDLWLRGVSGCAFAMTAGQGAGVRKLHQLLLFDSYVRE